MIAIQSLLDMVPIRFLAAAIVLLVLAADVHGQRPGRWSGGRDRGILRGDPVSLVRLSEVREELEVSEEQEQLLDALTDDLRDQRRIALRGGAVGPFDRRGRRSFDEIRSRMAALSRASEKLLLAVLEPQQAARLRELQLQSEGIRAFDREEFVAALDLTDDQREQIRRIRARAEEEEDDEDRSRDERRRNRRELESEVRSVLSDEQNAKWNATQGDPFEFPERRRFRGRRSS